MKHRFVFSFLGRFFFASLITMQLFAAPVSLEKARSVAVKWMEAKTGTTFHVKQTPLAGGTADRANVSSAYRLILLEPKGWVLVASDDVINPILGYGRSTIQSTTLPPALNAWLAHIDKTIKSITHSADTNDTHHLAVAYTAPNPRWEALEHPSKMLSATYEVSPLLWLGGSDESSGISWNQGEFYNAKTPADSASVDGKGRALTGCVAVAMGQVMRYYGKPEKGTGSFSYEDTIAKGYQHNYGILSANFGATTYDWSNMPKQLDASSTSAQVDAVSTLLYHAGVAVAMDYGIGGSSDGGSLAAYHDPSGGAAADTALKTYFGYKHVVWKERKDYTSSEWKALINTSLDDGDPLLYAGTGTGGHAFVLDGYTADGYYHFNWGFGGVANGNYLIDDLTPDGTSYNFSSNQQAIFMNEGGAVVVPSDGGGRKTPTGGGCTYNPHAHGMDAMLVLMAMLATLYPLGRRYFI